MLSLSLWVVIALSTSAMASLCVNEVVSSPTTIALQTITTQQRLFVEATDCVASNNAVPTLALSHHSISFKAPSFVYWFDAWTPDGSNSVVLKYHDIDGQSQSYVDIAQCPSCYPSQSTISLWISWENLTELSLGYGTEIGQNVQITANYSEYYGSLSMEYVSIWDQIGNCSFTIFEECTTTETTKTYTTSEPVAEDKNEDGAAEWMYFVVATGVLVFVLVAATGGIFWCKKGKHGEDTALDLEVCLTPRDDPRNGHDLEAENGGAENNGVSPKQITIHHHHHHHHHQRDDTECESMYTEEEGVGTNRSTRTDTVILPPMSGSLGSPHLVAEPTLDGHGVGVVQTEYV